MSADKLEAAALSGAFAQPSTSGSNRATREEDGYNDEAPGAHSDKGEDGGLGDSEEELDSDDATSKGTFVGSRSNRRLAADDPGASATLTIPARYANPSGRQTGVKGVLDDRRFSQLAAQSQRAKQVQSIVDEQLRRGMAALTVDEEDRLRKAEQKEKDRGEEEAGRRRWTSEDAADAEARARWRRARREEIEKERQRERGEEGVQRGGKGRVREVGQEGFLRAVERRGWVLVLIYEPNIPRCHALLASLLSLSLTLPPSIPLQLFRARAASLKFSLIPVSSLQTASATSTLVGQTPTAPINDPMESVRQASGAGDDDVEDEGDYEELANEGDTSEGVPDPDVLPTLLAYKDGELEKTWIRVDWELDEDGVEGLLRKEGIIPASTKMVGDHAESEDDD